MSGVQETFIPNESPDSLIQRARNRWSPVKTYCMFSGGNDSTVLGHRCRDHYDALFYIDTGLALPTVDVTTSKGDTLHIQGVEDFVHAYAEWIDKPLVIRRSGDAFRIRVLGDDRWWERYLAEGDGLSHEEFQARDKNRYGQKEGRVKRGPHKGFDLGLCPWGFPGAGGHGETYERLKGRRVEDLVREIKVGRSPRTAVLFLSGIRRDESAAREGYDPLTYRGSAKFVNPLTHWTNPEMAAYRRQHDLPESDVANLLHRSGECNCAAKGSWWKEREMIKHIWGDWFAATIESLEAEAKARGIRWCIWGGFDLEGNRAGGDRGSRNQPLCDCPSEQISLLAPERA